MKKGGLRHLDSTGEFFKMFVGTSRAMWKIRGIKPRYKVSPAFREKVMLAVTGVNKCKYCSYRHSRTALEAGVSTKDIKELLKGDIDNLPKKEVIAVSYAQHWAESKGEVSRDARKRVVDYYGKQKIEYIEAHIMSVYFGNMVSNTVYAYKNNLIGRKKKRKLFLTYILCYPIACAIKGR